MPPRSAVVIVVDRWGTASVGPYGNTWLDTPAMNALASRSLVCETVLVESPSLEDTYRSYWKDLRPAELTERGIASALVTDEPWLAEHPLAASNRLIVPASAAQTCADQVAHTGLARLFEAAAEALAGLDPPYLLWVHARGMAGPWDAPREFRDQFRDEDDPQAGDSAIPPEMQIGKDFHPDELLKLVHAYAGQVSLLDGQLAAFLEMVESRLEKETLIAVTSPRGYPLGEHGRVGPCDEALYGELLQVPLLVQFPGQQAALARTQEVLQPFDLGVSLAEHFGLSEPAPGTLGQIARNESHLAREIAAVVGREQHAVRTPGWFLRESHAGGERRHELFAKPDDRFEVNEVSSRCPHELELLVELLERLRQMPAGSPLASLAPLPDLLRDVWR